MEAPTPRIFTPGPIVALVLIALVAAGLAYLRFASELAPISVPASAKAGDLILEPCGYAIERGHKADCGTLVVPENRADPQSRLIALPVVRVRARSGRSAEPVFYLEGGPGGTNMKLKRASGLSEDRDVVFVGYRGVDGSVRLDCPEVVSMLKHSVDRFSEESYRAYGEAFRTCATRLTAEGVDPTAYGFVQQIDDLERARAALGYNRINLLSESAGTRTAIVYAWRYPKSIYRSVMVAVNTPGHFLWYPETTDEQIARYAALCGKDESCRGRTDDLAATLRRTSANMPKRWLFLPIKDSNVRVLSYMGLMESTAAAGAASGPVVLDAWLSAAEGDASGVWFSSFLADLIFPQMFVWGQYAAFGSPDGPFVRDYFSSPGHERANLGRAITAFVWGGGRLAEAWPLAREGSEYTRVRTSEVETLLIGGSLDFSTPPQIATRELLPSLPKGRQVLLTELGHTADFWSYQPDARNRMLNTFFDSGRIDDSLYKPAVVDFTPEMTMSGLAKRALGVMIGLAVLAVLSLLGMAIWVRRRGGFGRRAGAALRSVYPIVLGLGGWFLGALIVLAALPGVPLDNALLAVLSVGVPVGLGLYWAWVRRDWTVVSKRVGLVSATVGALAGAWAGFLATGGLLALVTAIVGAAAGANLALILVDMSRVRAFGRSSHG